MNDTSVKLSPKQPAQTPSNQPMPAAPIVYNKDGSVAWDQMWDTFCTLASAGGPPHRGRLLAAPPQIDTTSESYQKVTDELIRGICLVSGLEATSAKPGWLAVKCAHAVQARWMSEQILHETVQSFHEDDFFFVPVASTYTVTAEIKNIITVVAKTSHYWQDHLQGEVKRLMAWESRIVGALRLLSGSARRQAK
jgi:sirohydrochlorin cobaltochelatase